MKKLKNKFEDFKGLVDCIFCAFWDILKQHPLLLPILIIYLIAGLFSAVIVSFCYPPITDKYK